MPIDKKKTLPPFSLRLTPEERAQLEKDATGMSLGAYIRSRIFDGSLPNRGTRNKFPVKDHKALAKVLSELGRSRLANNMNQVARAINKGTSDVTPEMEIVIQNGYADIHKIRHMLMTALGLIEEKNHDFERLTAWWSQATGDAPVKSGRKRAC